MVTTPHFYINDKIKMAYVAKRAKDFNFLVAGQAEDIYRDWGMVFPVSVSSTLEFIARSAPVSQSVVSRALDQPHQLIAYRIKELEKLKLVQRKIDPNDGRRTLLHLTSKGRAQAKILNKFTVMAADAFNELFEEIGIDLSEGLGKALAALKSRPLDERFAQPSTFKRAS